LTLAACGGGTSATTPAPEALSGTIVVHVSGHGRQDAKLPLRITRLGSKGEDLSSLETGEHTIHVAPGNFEVIVLGTPPEKGLGGAGQKVIVGPNQEVKVAISLQPSGHSSTRHSR
jgi:hypothetical protein